MTAPFRRTAKCPNCRYDIPLEDEIGQWVRTHQQLKSGDGFTFMDRDMICHRFKTTHGREFQCLMFVEWKSRGGQLNDVQRDTMHITNQMFRTDSTTPTKRGKSHLHQVPNGAWSVMANKKVAVKAFGYHLVRMNGSTPDDSTQIMWDKQEVSKEQLIQLLRFDINPDTLRPMDWRIHHRKEKESQLL